MYDAIVIGARCAGSPTAMLLARKGYRVLLVDKATFPSDIMSTHYIHQPGVAQLKRWGLLNKVRASNCPPILQSTLGVGDCVLTGLAPSAGDVTEGYCPRRTVLDKILVDAAVEAGAELREGFLVQELLGDGDRITGIRGRPKGGMPVTEQARIIIGADGLHSFLARTVQPPTYNERPTIQFGYYSYWSGVPLEGVEIYVRDYRAALIFPTNDSLACVVAAQAIAGFHEFRSDIEGNYLKTLALVAPGPAERVRSGKREERFVGTADLPNFFRKPYGPGWALVGDAGYHKDPSGGYGITDAFRDAELLAGAIDEGLAGHRPLDQALAEYERQRNNVAMPIYEMTCQAATFAPPSPEEMQLFTALRGNQAETNRFLGTLAGTVPISEFFAPENIQRIIDGRKPE